jgi:hypothetical protein
VGSVVSGSGSSPAPVTGSKRAATSGGSTPPSKRFCCAWKPQYAEQLCSHPLLFFYLYYISLNFLLTSTPATGATGFVAGGSPGASGAQDAPDGVGAQDSLTVVAGSDGVPAPNTTTAAEAMVTSEAAIGDPAASTNLVAGASSSPPRMATATASMSTDNNDVEEPEVIMGHPDLRVSGTVSLSEVMGTTHFALN